MCTDPFYDQFTFRCAYSCLKEGWSSSAKTRICIIVYGTISFYSLLYINIFIIIIFERKPLDTHRKFSETLSSLKTVSVGRQYFNISFLPDPHVLSLCFH
jgi:hypothetical protein